MSATTSKRPPRLPAGLVACETCGEPRGRATSGGLSVCFCQGVACTWCGEVRRRPITDYYATDVGWTHVPWFSLGAHACPAPKKARVGEQWTIRPIDDDVRVYSDAVTRLALAEVEERAGQR